MIRSLTSLGAALLALSVPALAQESWVEKSNENAQVVLDVLVRFNPEGAAQLGVEGYDAEIIDLKEGIYERGREAGELVVAELERRLESESHPKVRQDLEILIGAIRDNLHTGELNRDNLIPYFNLPQGIFFGFRGLLNPQNDPERYPAALERLKKYVGSTDGYESVFAHATDRMKERFEVDGLVGPYLGQVEKDLENFPRFVSGIEELFKGSGLEGWEQDFAAFSEQVGEYEGWLRREMLPRSRESHQLPEALYGDNLRGVGVYMDPADLIERATFGFAEIRNEMQAIASRIAAERGWESGDYRDVIRRLKQDQLENDEVLGFYRQRLEDVEQLIAENDVVTMPERDAQIRLATEAESAAVPAPFMQPPRLIGNTGEYGTFVIPLSNPTATTGEKMDDFMHDAAAWTLTVHEARPGHEMQFSAMVENGVSIARAVFAFNSANVEGWGLYSEAIMKEYLPLDGQLLSLHGRLMRAARAFIDPMLNLGQIEPEQAKRFIMEQVVLSEPMATQEVDRYTFRAPGQATAYYYGLIKLQSIRTKAELALGDRFRQRAFHDFILAQGVIPYDLLARAVESEFIPSQME